ncbi:hypothetical protein KY289_030380 [Solanum tuberosum]|nr:hypothetical protein KY289_030380 [Solanum tuberosum]
MARETPPELPRPPDELQQGRLNDSNKTQLATLSNSSHNSTKLQNTDAINTAISVKELEGTREFISTGDNTLIRGKGIGNMESTNLDLQHSKQPSDSTVPIARNREAISARIANSSPEMRPQIRATSSQIRADSVTGEYSPHDKSQKFQAKWMVESSPVRIPAKIKFMSPEYTQRLGKETYPLQWTFIHQRFQAIWMKETPTIAIQFNLLK